MPKVLSRGSPKVVSRSPLLRPRYILLPPLDVTSIFQARGAARASDPSLLAEGAVRSSQNFRPRRHVAYDRPRRGRSWWPRGGGRRVGPGAAPHHPRARGRAGRAAQRAGPGLGRAGRGRRGPGAARAGLLLPRAHRVGRVHAPPARDRAQRGRWPGHHFAARRPLGAGQPDRAAVRRPPVSPLPPGQARGAVGQPGRRRRAPAARLRGRRRLPDGAQPAARRRGRHPPPGVLPGHPEGRPRAGRGGAGQLQRRDAKRARGGHRRARDRHRPGQRRHRPAGAGLPGRHASWTASWPPPRRCSAEASRPPPAARRAHRRRA